MNACLDIEANFDVLKASKSQDQTADMVLLLFGPQYNRQLLSYTEQVDKANAKVSYLISSVEMFKIAQL